MAESTRTHELKRVLGFWDLMSTSIGQIIGAGIMSLTGVAIAMTGRSTPLAFILAAVFVIAFSIPQVIIYSTARFNGGQYSTITALAGKQWGGFFVILFVLTNISLAMYALSFADYALAFLPSMGRKAIAITILTVFYILNYFGIDKMAKIQNLIVACLIVSLALFAIFGVSKIDPNYFDGRVFPNGVKGLLQTSALLTFATGGALVVSNLAGEAKNPTKHIPLVIIVSTILVAVLYGFIATIAAGVLPVEDVANQPLTWVAEVILPKGLYIFFIVGGAMFALISTLNAQLAWATKPLLQASYDGWLPKKFGYLHPKYKTPTVYLTFFYLVGLIPIVFNLDIDAIGSYVVIINSVLMLFLTYCLLKLPDVMPDLWEKSAFKVSRPTLYLFFTLSVIVNIMQIYLLASDWTLPVFIGNVCAIALGAIYSVARYRSGKVEMEVSYEAI